MKKVKVIIAILVFLIVIIAVALIILNINKEKAEAKAREEQYYKEEISSTNFKIPEYQSIENIVFYSGATEETKNDFINIANTMKEEYPGKSILYVSGAVPVGKIKIYTFVQIDNGQILEHTEMNVTISEDNTVNIEMLIGESWKEGNDINNTKISTEKAQEITINYLLEHPECYEKMHNRKMYNIQGEFHSSKKQCNIIFYQYKSKPVWMMIFEIGRSYIMIDANTGRILKTYFSNGVTIN